jgi:hypothetical protein
VSRRSTLRTFPAYEGAFAEMNARKLDVRYIIDPTGSQVRSSGRAATLTLHTAGLPGSVSVRAPRGVRAVAPGVYEIRRP